MKTNKTKNGLIVSPTLQTIILTVVFGIAFALVEAAIVIYLRKLFGIDGNYELPIPTKEDIMVALPHFVVLKSIWGKTIIPQANILYIELMREAATIIMLATVGILAARHWWQRLGVFLIAFGIWDIFYYVFLYLFLGWPPTLKTYDVLFLIPGPWIAPVWLPILISIVMICLGCYLVATPNIATKISVFRSSRSK
ncbi:hypothetical protein DRH29_00530 [candidate division Kazan bacterium]|uniref:Uncharacterized protein n=1 Tax=candidate division Kazan bacterium TaxID=2202143 RepID=A0A420ZDZ5_UNCK3|nr:MAG: hypothetical protein DRH29_00530 [candidate division Kazan bacterium]